MLRLNSKICHLGYQSETRISKVLQGQYKWLDVLYSFAIRSCFGMLNKRRWWSGLGYGDTIFPCPRETDQIVKWLPVVEGSINNNEKLVIYSLLEFHFEFINKIECQKSQVTCYFVLRLGPIHSCYSELHWDCARICDFSDMSTTFNWIWRLTYGVWWQVSRQVFCLI